MEDGDFGDRGLQLRKCLSRAMEYSGETNKSVRVAASVSLLILSALENNLSLDDVIDCIESGWSRISKVHSMRKELKS